MMMGRIWFNIQGGGDLMTSYLYHNTVKYVTDQSTICRLHGSSVGSCKKSFAVVYL